MARAVRESSVYGTLATLDAPDGRFAAGGASMSSDGAYRRFDLPGDLSPADLERALWLLVALSLVGDVATTFVGLRLGLAESNPVARSAIDGHGVVGMLLLKGVAVGIALGCRPILPRVYRPVVPAGLLVPWAIAVCINVYMISTVV